MDLPTIVGISLGLAAFSAGLIVPFLFVWWDSRRSLDKKVAEFNEIMKKIGVEHNGMAEKMIQLEERVNTVSMHNTINQSTMGMFKNRTQT